MLHNVRLPIDASLEAENYREFYFEASNMNISDTGF